MKFKKIYVLIIAVFVIFSSMLPVFATEYVFDENGVVVAEPETDGIRNDDEDTAIGIIGGADGPTTVFVSGNPVGVVIIVAVAVAVVLITVPVVFLIKKRNKK